QRCTNGVHLGGTFVPEPQRRGCDARTGAGAVLCLRRQWTGHDARDPYRNWRCRTGLCRYQRHNSSLHGESRAEKATAAPPLRRLSSRQSVPISSCAGRNGEQATNERGTSLVKLAQRVGIVGGNGWLGSAMAQAALSSGVLTPDNLTISSRSGLGDALKKSGA